MNGDAVAATEPLTVRGLSVYPLKSGAAIALDQAQVTPEGFVGDRRLMVVDDDGRFVTQRGHPRLALVRAHIEDAPGGRVVIDVPGEGGAAATRFELTSDDRADTVRVEVWGDEVDASPLDPALDEALSRYLDRRVHVVRFGARAVRPVDPTYARPGDRVGFADAFPFLVTTTASLAALNAALDTPVTMDRFRPNIVVATEEPWVEDRWARIRIGPPERGIELELPKTCGRCVTINVDQARGTSGREPLRTLTRLRTIGQKVVFGQNAIARGVGVLRLGDPVEVLETR